MSDPQGNHLSCGDRCSCWQCVEAELVRQVHTLFVRSAQQVVVFDLQVREEVEGMRQEVREVKVESKVEESRSLHEHMTWMTNTRLMA